MARPKVSVAIPNRNKGAFLREAVKNALTQTFTDIEVVVVDNASTDAGLQVLRDLLVDARLRLVQNDRDIGGEENFQKAIDLSKGEYIKLLCSDDYLHPDCIAQMVDVLDTHPSVGIVTSPRIMVDQTGGQIGLLQYLQEDIQISGREAIDLYLLNQVNYIGEPTAVMFRRDLHVSFGMLFGKRYRDGMSDLVTWLDILQRADLFHISQPLCYFRQYDGMNSRLPGTLAAWAAAASDLVRDHLERGFLSAPGPRGRAIELATRNLSEQLARVKGVACDPALVSRLEVALEYWRNTPARVIHQTKTSESTQPEASTAFRSKNADLENGVSVVIATYNRRPWLRRCLEGFCSQTLSRSQFEIIVVDDHSDEDLTDLIFEFQIRLPLRYIRHERNRGLGAARNTGTSASRGWIVLFFDDDDYPGPALLAEHLRTHKKHPEENAAVLGYTAWDPQLDVNPVMRHVTEVGKQYLSYPDLTPCVPLPWHCFWGGRSSLKRALLATEENFDQDFAILEDIDLAYRLRRVGFHVYLNRDAISYAMRPLDYDSFCERWKRQGKGVAHMLEKHRNPELLEHFNVREAKSRYKKLSDMLPTIEPKIRQLQDLPLTTLRATQVSAGDGRTVTAEQMLHECYAAAFEMHRLQGYLEAGTTHVTDTSTGSSRGRVLIVAPELPALDRASGSLRLFEVVKLLRQAGLSVVFVARAAAGQLDPRPYVQALTDIGVEVIPVDPDRVFQKWGVRLDAPKLELPQLLRKWDFDAAYLYFYELADQYINEIRRWSPRTRVIVDSVDVHFLREERLAALKRDENLLQTSRRTKEVELAVYRRADLVVAVTEADKKVLQREVPGLQVEVLPNIHSCSTEVPGFDSRRDIIFVGGFPHLPNVDAAAYFCAEVWPLVTDRLPDARLLLVGNDPPEAVKRLASDRVVVTGFVPDTKPFLDGCRVSIAPLRFGAGMKGKVGEALAAGLPVVATTIAAEGMGLESGSHVLVADDPAGFAEAVVRLYNDKGLWTSLSGQGREFIRERYSPEAVAKKLGSLLSDDALNAQESLRRADEHSPAVTLVIPVFNNLPLTQQCLGEIRRNTRKGSYEVIVVDNASSDGTVHYLRSEQAKGHLLVISNAENLAFAKACNQGAERAQGRYVLFLNNDTIPHPGWLDALIEMAESDPQIGVVGSKLLYPDGTIQHAGIVAGMRDGELYPYHVYLCQPANAPHVNKAREFQMVTGACLMVRRDVFLSRGGFDEAFVNGHEDLDLCLNVRNAGYKVMYCPESVVTHLESRTKRLTGIENHEYRKGVENEEARGRRRFLSKWQGALQVDDQDYYRKDGFALSPTPSTTGTENKLHIMFTMYGWADEGGGTILPRQIAKALVRRGHQVTVVYTPPQTRPDKPAYHVEESREDGVRLFAICNRPAVFYDYSHPEREVEDPAVRQIMAKLITNLKPDIVHYHSFLNFSMAAADEVRRAGIPSVYTSHNYWPLCPRMYLFQEDLTICSGPSPDGSKCATCLGEMTQVEAYARRWKEGQRLLGTLVDRHLAVSTRVRQLFIQNGHDPTRIHILQQQPETVDLNWSRIGSVRKAESDDSRPLKVGFIGSLLPQKGVHVLVRALQALRRDQMEGRVYGSGPESYINALQQMDQKKLLRFHGRYVPGQLPDLLKEVDVVVVPSIWEDCAPLVVAEALACRVPVIGSRIGGIPDFVLDGIDGFLFDPRDAAGLASILYRLANDRTLLARMQRDIRPPKGFDGYLNELETHYREVIAEHRAHAVEPIAQTERRDPLAITWEGSQFVHHSLALINRELCLQLLDAGHEVSIIPYEPDQFSPKSDPRLGRLAEKVRAKLSRPADVHVRHQWPPRFDAPTDGHWVMIQPWEFGSLPKKWIEEMRSKVDEVWVPSSWVRQSYIESGLPADRIHVVPNGVDTERFRPDARPMALNTQKRFKFLFVGGTIYRKGSDVLLNAYRAAFRASDDVCLVVKDMGGKSFYQGQTAEQQIRALQADPEAPEILYLSEDIPDAELPGLYTACDCLVHPYRGEGFGLPMAEAMACGLPVIVTGAGACLDFCDETVAYLIPARKQYLPEKRIGNLETVDQPYMYEPDGEATARLMRHVFEHRGEAREVGSRAAKRIQSQFTWRHAAEKAIARIHELRERPIVRMADHHEAITTLVVGQPHASGQLWSSLARGTGRPLAITVVGDLHGKQTGEDAILPAGSSIRTSDESLVEQLNQALEHSKSEVVVVLSSDVVVTDGLLQTMLATIERDPEAAVVGPSSNRAPKAQQITAKYDGAGKDLRRFARRNAQRNDGKAEAVPHLGGFCLALNVSACRQIGTLRSDVDFHLSLWDYLGRVTQSGLHAAVARDAYVHHEELLEQEGADYDALADAQRSMDEILSKGRTALESGDFETAVSHFRRSAEEFPGLAAIHSALASTLISAGRPEESIEPLRSAIALTPRDAGLRNQLGVALFQLGRYAEAEAALIEAKAEDPNDIQVRLNLVDLHRFQQRYEEASAAMKDAVRTDPDHPDVLASFGALCLELGDVEGAKMALKRLQATHPRHPGVDMLRSNIATTTEAVEPPSQDRPPSVGRQARTEPPEIDAPLPEPTLFLDPNAVMELLRPGQEALERGDLEAAAAEFGWLARRHGDLAAAQTALGSTLTALGRIDEAIGPLRRAAELTPNAAAMHNQLGVALFKLNDFEGAETAFKKGHAADSDDVHSLLNLVDLYRAQGRYDDATGAIKEAVSIDANNPDVLIDFGTLSLELGDAEGGEMALKRLENVQPDHPLLSALREAVDTVRAAVMSEV